MKKSHKRLYFIIGIFVFLYLIIKFIQLYSVSLFTFKGNRINIVIYGQEAAFYSLDKQDTRHYVMYFYPDLKMQVPGGYGDYRVGSLGKLAKLDKNPDILRKTFAIATTSFVNFTFYPNTEDVYYGRASAKRASVPSIKDIAFMSGNANILDRLYLIGMLVDKNNDDFYVIAYNSEISKIHNDVFFGENSFIKNSLGLLFQKRYRDEQKNIQLLYKSEYNVAEKISALLEGNGIRVNDITLDMNRNTSCKIVESSSEHSQTALDMASYFDCSLEVGKTDVYDILFVLGNVEKSWEIR